MPPDSLDSYASLPLRPTASGALSYFFAESLASCPRLVKWLLYAIKRLDAVSALRKRQRGLM